MLDNTFVGARKPLDEWDVPQMAHRLDTGEDELSAFLEVEARSRGYDRQGRPIMLGEPHVFYRNLSGAERTRAVKAGLAYPEWGTKPYPKESYTWLKKAMKINEDAALMSCSIGLSQVLVENYSSVGYGSPQEMWQAFMDDEQEHVEAMVRFILVNGIDDDLREHRWARVARVYNGPGYKKNRYDTKMAAAFAKFKRVKDVDWSPDDDREGTILDVDQLREVQKKLRSLNYPEAGRPDGHWGSRTRAAVLAYRADHGLPITASIDKEFLASLYGSKGRTISETRANATAKDLRNAGSRTIKAADGGTAGGALVGVTGAVGVVTGVLDQAEVQLDKVTTMFGDLEPMLETFKNVSPWLVVGLGAYIVYTQFLVKGSRVGDHQTGKNAGPDEEVV